MKKLLYLLVLTLSIHTAKAQYVGGANEQRKVEMKRENERLNNVYQNNLPNSKGSNIKILAPVYEKTEVYVPSEYEKRQNAIRISEAEAFNAQLKIKNQQNALNRYYAKEKFCNDMFNKNIANSILDKLDLKEYIQWFYADNYEGTKLIDERVTFALQRLRNYFADSATGTFDSCTNRLWDATIFPSTCIAALEKLKARFPSKINAIEKQQLYTMKYIFGARFPKWKNSGENDMAYANCQIHLIETAEERNALLNKFLFLYYKYPAFTLENVAGKARVEYNPFYMVSTANRYDGGISKELRINMLKLVLFSKADSILPIYKKNRDNEIRQKQIIKDRLKTVAKEIRNEFPLLLYSLTANDWVKISEAQGVDLELIGEVFFDAYKEKKPLKDYVHYQNALKGKLDVNFKNGIQKIDVDFEHYEGYVENGIPNGEGKWCGSSIYTFSGYCYTGIFKNGLPTKKGIIKNEYNGKELPDAGFDFDNKDKKYLYIIATKK